MADAAPGPGDERGPNSYPLKPRLEYRAPSFLWEHRYLLVVFVLVLIVATVLMFRLPHQQYHGLTPAPLPVYVEPIPQNPTIPERPASSAR